MKGFFKILSVVILLAALNGAIFLAKNNLDTRKGAAVNETSSMVLPSVIEASPESILNVNVWLNTGNSNDKMAGAEFRVIYPVSKLKFVEIEPQSGYTLVNDLTSVEKTDDYGNTYLDIRLVTLGTEVGGAVEVAKIKFLAIEGSGSLLVQQGKIMISGQDNIWNIESNIPSNFLIGNNLVLTPVPSLLPSVVVPTLAKKPTITTGFCGWCGTTCKRIITDEYCPTVMPPAGVECVEMSGVCLSKKIITTGTPPQMPTTTPTLCKEGVSGFSVNENCGTGMYRYSTFKCYDGYSQTQGSGSSCKTSADWRSNAEQICEGRSNCRLTPTRYTTPTVNQLKTCAMQGGVCKSKAGVCGDGAYRYVSSSDCTQEQNCCVPLTTPARAPTVTIKPIITIDRCGWCGMSCTKTNPSQYCPTVMPPEGKVCVDVGGVCTIKNLGSVTLIPVPTITPMVNPTCGTRCTNNSICGSGMICAPIWWPCAQLPATVLSKLQSDMLLIQSDVNLILQSCPDVQKILPAGYENLTQVKMPSFYGLCRSEACVNCRCGGMPTGVTGPSVRPTISLVPTIRMPQPTAMPNSFWANFINRLLGR